MVYLITGKMNSYKTTRTIELARNMPLSDGFVSLKTMNNQDVVQFELMKLSTKEKRTLAIHRSYFHHQFNDTLELGPYIFNQAVFAWAEQEVKLMIEHHLSTIFLDEIGMLEINNKGFYSIIKLLLQSESDCYFTIRNQFVQPFLSHFQINRYQILS